MKVLEFKNIMSDIDTLRIKVCTKLADSQDASARTVCKNMCTVMLQLSAAYEEIERLRTFWL